MPRSLLLLFCLLLLPQAVAAQAPADSGLVVTEVMSNPVGDEAVREYVELLNLGPTARDLTGLRLGDNSTTKSPLAPLTGGMIVQPGQYVVVLDRDYPGTGALYSIPDNALLVTVTSAQIGNSLTNGGDAVRLFSAAGDTLDAFTWTKDLGDGVPWIRATPHRGAPIVAGTAGGTPGGPDPTVRPRRSELTLTATAPAPLPTAGGRWQPTLRVTNAGPDTALAPRLRLFRDDNGDDRLSPGEPADSLTLARLAPGATVQPTLGLTVVEGDNRFVVELTEPSDSTLSDNRVALRSTIAPASGPVPPGALVINEIHYAPVTPNPEWVELYNPTAAAVTLPAGSKLTDGVATTPGTLPAVTVAADGYLVVTKDSAAFRRRYPTFTGALVQAISFPTLNNPGDDVVLLAPARVDSVHYLAAWGGASGDRSLERLNPLDPPNTAANWATSRDADGATPGRVNSVRPKPTDWAFSKPQLLPTGDGSARFSVRVTNAGRNALPEAAALLFADLADDSTRTAAEPGIERTIPALAVGDSVRLSADLAGLPTGVLIHFRGRLTGVDDDLASNETSVRATLPPPVAAPGGLIVTECLAEPVEGPEWVELLNRTARPLTLTGYKLTDGSTIGTVQSAPAVPPGGYVVLTGDTLAFRESWPGAASARLIRVTSFPSLNNAGDVVKLTDPSGIRLDSLKYAADWGLGRGRSSERIDLGGATADAGSWAPTAVPTPGRPTPRPAGRSFDLTVRRVTASGSGRQLTGVVTVKNAGSNPATGAGYGVRLGPDVRLDGRDLAPGDSTDLPFTISAASGTVLLTARIEPSAGFVDRRAAGDSLAFTAVLRPEAGRVLINEAMVDPPTGEPEWVELALAEPVDLSSWILADSSKTGRGTVAKGPPLPAGFVILTGDTAAFRAARPGVGPVRLVTSMPSLGNTGDRIILRTPTGGAAVESLAYDSRYPLRVGRSLERQPTEPEGWLPSIASGGATPGAANSTGDLGLGLVINEIGYHPLPGEPEWVELFNPTPEPVVVRFITVTDAPATGTYALPDRTVAPGGFLVVAADTGLARRYPTLNSADLVVRKGAFSLSNDGETVYLRSARGRLVDSVAYSVRWAAPEVRSLAGVSLERISPAGPSNDGLNWSSSKAFPAGGTPGAINSVSRAATAQAAGPVLTSSLNPFSPEAGGFTDLGWTLPRPASRLRLRIYDATGRLVRVLIDNLPSDLIGAARWYGDADDGGRLRIGIYLAHLDATDASGAVITTATLPVVLARSLR